MIKRPDVTLTIRLPADLSGVLDRAAKDYDQTRGEMIRQALAKFLDHPASSTEAQPQKPAATGDYVIQ